MRSDVWIAVFALAGCGRFGYGTAADAIRTDGGSPDGSGPDADPAEAAQMDTRRDAATDAPSIDAMPDGGPPSDASDADSDGDADVDAGEDTTPRCVPIAPSTLAAYAPLSSQPRFAGNVEGLLAYRTSASTFVSRFDASGARVGTDGTVPDSDEPSILAVGSDTLVGWNDGANVFITRLDASFAALGTSTALDETHHNVQYGARLAGGGGVYGAIWMSWSSPYNRIVFALIDAMGARVATEIELDDTQTDPEHVALHWNGRQFGAVWLNDNGRYVVLDQIDATGALIQHHELPSDYAGAAAAWSAWSNAWVVAYATYPDGTLELVRFSEAGAELSRTPLPSLSWPESMAIVSTETADVVFALVKPATNWEIVAAHVDRNGTITDVPLVSTANCIYDFDATAAADGSYWLAVTRGRGPSDCTSQDVALTAIACDAARTAPSPRP